MADHDWSTVTQAPTEHDWSAPQAAPPAKGSGVTYNPRTWEYPSLSAVPGAVGNILKMPYTLGKSVVEGLRAAPDVQWKDVTARNVGEAAMETAKPMIGPAGGAIVGSTLGPPGMALGAMGGQFAQSALEQLTSGKRQDPTDVLEKGLTAGGATSAGGILPGLLKRTPGKIVRRTASGESRMEATAQGLEKIPDRFNTSDAIVKQAYDHAEKLAQSTTAVAPMQNLLGSLTKQIQSLRGGMFPELENRALLKDLESMQANQSVFATGGRAEQINKTLQQINQKIRGFSSETQSVERGVYKQLLGGLHEDMRAAYASTRSPAFKAFSDAIQKAHLNFLREDLETVITRSGIRNLRGDRTVANPAAIENFMRNEPDWVASVEKAQPGLIASIQSDIDALNPVANTVAGGLSGGHFGSGRMVLGGAMGHLFRSMLGMPPGTAEALGAIAGNLSRRGINYAPSTITRAFGPKPPMVSPAGGAAGSALSGLLGQIGQKEPQP